MSKIHRLIWESLRKDEYSDLMDISLKDMEK